MKPGSARCACGLDVQFINGAWVDASGSVGFVAEGGDHFHEPVDSALMPEEFMAYGEPESPVDEPAASTQGNVSPQGQGEQDGAEGVEYGGVITPTGRLFLRKTGWCLRHPVADIEAESYRLAHHVTMAAKAILESKSKPSAPVPRPGRGDMILDYLGSAHRREESRESERIEKAKEAVAAAQRQMMVGQRCPHGFQNRMICPSCRAERGLA